MVALGLIIGSIVLFYWWLKGHWFARVMAFLVLVALGFLATSRLMPVEPIGAWSFLLALLALGWLTSGIPVYARHPPRLKQLQVMPRHPIQADKSCDDCPYH